MFASCPCLGDPPHHPFGLVVNILHCSWQLQRGCVCVCACARACTRACTHCLAFSNLPKDSLAKILNDLYPRPLIVALLATGKPRKNPNVNQQDANWINYGTSTQWQDRQHNKDGKYSISGRQWSPGYITSEKATAEYHFISSTRICWNYLLL